MTTATAFVPAADPDLAALVRGCLNSPADPTPRLVLADWLQEQDDPRAPWLRVGPFVAARLEETDPAWHPEMFTPDKPDNWAFWSDDQRGRVTRAAVVATRDRSTNDMSANYPSPAQHLPSDTIFGLHSLARLYAVALLRELVRVMVVVDQREDRESPTLGDYHRFLTGAELYACRLHAPCPLVALPSDAKDQFHRAGRVYFHARYTRWHAAFKPNERGFLVRSRSGRAIDMATRAWLSQPLVHDRGKPGWHTRTGADLSKWDLLGRVWQVFAAYRSAVADAAKQTRGRVADLKACPWGPTAWFRRNAKFRDPSRVILNRPIVPTAPFTLAEPLKLSDGRTLPVGTPVRQQPHTGYWEPVTEEPIR